MYVQKYLSYKFANFVMNIRETCECVKCCFKLGKNVSETLKLLKQAFEIILNLEKHIVSDFNV